ncbi:unnamed protein product [Symbiodinium sp. CCMP2456]|nr:unnamed protein product [Symbiodinium sp. CCMP2456]
MDWDETQDSQKVLVDRLKSSGHFDSDCEIRPAKRLRLRGKTPSYLCIPDAEEDEDPDEENNDENYENYEGPAPDWVDGEGDQLMGLERASDDGHDFHEPKYYAQDGTDFDWEAAHEGHVKWCQAAGVNPEVTSAEEEPETEPAAETVSKCGSCHWLDGDGRWHVGPVPELDDETTGQNDGAEGQDAQWEADGDDLEVPEQDDEPWEQAAENDDPRERAEQWGACENDDPEQAGDEAWEDDDPCEQAEQWEACEVHDPEQAADEAWENDDPREQAEQWEAWENEDPKHDEQREDDENDDPEQEEQWEDGENDDPEQDEQWKDGENDGPEQDEQWEDGENDDPKPDEQCEDADDEDAGQCPKHEKQRNEEWPESGQPKEAPGDHVAGSAEADSTWVNWPRAAATNVTQDYPTKDDQQRLDAWWSKYRVKEPTPVEKQEIGNPDLPASLEAVMPSNAKPDRTRDTKGPAAFEIPTTSGFPGVPDKVMKAALGAKAKSKGKKKQLKRAPYADTEYNVQRKKFFATLPPMPQAERQSRWNNSEFRKQVLAGMGMDVNEMKRRRYVKQANRLARRVAYLLEYQHRAGSFYVLENPSGSMLFDYPCVKVTLWGTAPFMDKLYEQLTGTRRNQLRRIQSFLKMDISRGYIDEHGRSRRVGGKDLTKTAVYPGTLALKVAELMEEHFATLKPRASVSELDMELCDTNDADSSDSGLEGLVGSSMQ